MSMHAGSPHVQELCMLRGQGHYLCAALEGPVNILGAVACALNKPCIFQGGHVDAAAWRIVLRATWLCTTLALRQTHATMQA